LRLEGAGWWGMEGGFGGKDGEERNGRGLERSHDLLTNRDWKSLGESGRKSKAMMDFWSWGSCDLKF